MPTPLKLADNNDRRRLEKRVGKVFDSADEFVAWMRENYGIPHRHTIRSVVRLIPTKNAIRLIHEALAAVKEASDGKADKPKWQSPIRECDTYWKKMKGYIHLMTHPADGFTDWKETPPRGCDTKSVPYRMGDRLNLSLMSQDPLWQFYHTVFWSEDPDACPPT